LSGTRRDLKIPPPSAAGTLTADVYGRWGLPPPPHTHTHTHTHTLSWPDGFRVAGATTTHGKPIRECIRNYLLNPVCYISSLLDVTCTQVGED